MKNKYILITSALVMASFIGGYFLGRNSASQGGSVTAGPGGAPVKVAFLPFNIQPNEDQKKALEKIEANYGKQVVQARQALSKVITMEQQQKRAEATRKAIQEGKKGKELMDFVEKESGITPEQHEQLKNAQRELGQLMTKMNTEVNQLLTENQKKEIEDKRQEMIKQNAARAEAASKAASVKTPTGKDHSPPKEQSKTSILKHHK